MVICVLSGTKCAVCGAVSGVNDTEFGDAITASSSLLAGRSGGIFCAGFLSEYGHYANW